LIAKRTQNGSGRTIAQVAREVELSHDYPSEIDQKQLDELHLIIKYPEKKE
jgi:hypothetical protein